MKLFKKHDHTDCPECSKVEQALKKSPINYFSDLFIVSMVCLWIFDNIYQSLIASAVTISSIVISMQTGIATYDTSMWSSIGTNVAIPLSCGGAIWMIKNSVQHAIAYSKGRTAHQDFPKTDVDNYDIEARETEADLESTEDSSDDTESPNTNGVG